VQRVERFAKHFHNCNPRSISPGEGRACIATLKAGHSLKTVREAELALRRFFRSLAREGSEWTRSPPITKQR
jgi:hypothetical protein